MEDRTHQAVLAAAAAAGVREDRQTMVASLLPASALAPTATGAVNAHAVLTAVEALLRRVPEWQATPPAPATQPAATSPAPATSSATDLARQVEDLTRQMRFDAGLYDAPQGPTR